MNSDFFPSPHSCNFCRKLVLYKKDSKWWMRAVASNSEGLQAEDLEDVGPVLSSRVKEWLTRQLDFQEQSKFTESTIELLLTLHNIAIFDCTIAEVYDAAMSRCRLCESIIDVGRQTSREDFSFLAADMRHDNFILFGAIKKTVGFGKASFEVVRLHSKDTRPQPVALPNNNAASKVSTRPINPRPGSDESLSLVRTWLHKCLRTHTRCSKPKQDFMPTRVIEIRGKIGLTYLLRLRETRGAEPYTALSYCWGGEQRLTTTTKTINQHRREINMNDLPVTVRDAIIVSAKLGIMKIWIDAFCIMQNDPIDKAREISRMMLVYSQATLTIAASRAKEANEGFLHERSRMGDDHPELVFELPFQCANNQLGSVMLLPPLHKSTEPLDSRAWALQERFMSPRILEFGSIQTRWICQDTDLQNSPTDGYNSRLTVHKDYIFKLGLEAVLFSDSDLYAWDSIAIADHRRRWYDIVNVYTHRSLTFGTDRLPAISGIAAQFERILCDEYKAGLWKSTMVSELLWSTDRSTEPQLRPEEYQGPSWSWAALNVPIKFPLNIDGDTYLDIVGCHIKTSTASGKLSVYDTSFGAIQSGSLEVRGSLQPAEWVHYVDPSGKNPYSDTLRAKRLNGIGTTVVPAEMYPDAIEPEFAHANPCSIPVFLLAIRHEQIGGLVLRKRSDSTFSRLGTFLFYGFYGSYSSPSDYGLAKAQQTTLFRKFAESLKNAPLQTITIV